jgi:hypothetical protein
VAAFLNDATNPTQIGSDREICGCVKWHDRWLVNLAASFWLALAPRKTCISGSLITRRASGTPFATFSREQKSCLFDRLTVHQHICCFNSKLSERTVLNSRFNQILK